MSTLRTEKTTNRAWLARQTDRLIGWEMLKRAMYGDNHPMSAEDMCDKIGVGPDYFALMLMKLRRRQIERGSIGTQPTTND